MAVTIWLSSDGCHNMVVTRWLSSDGCHQNGCHQMAVARWLSSDGRNVIRWLSPYWLSPNGCHQMSVTWWLSPDGYHQMAVTRWLSSDDCHRMVVIRWLSSDGCHNMAVAIWLFSFVYIEHNFLVWKTQGAMALQVLSHHILEFLGSRRDGNCAYVYWGSFTFKSSSVRQAIWFTWFSEPHDTTSLHACLIVYTAPGSPRRSPIQLWTGHDVA